MLLCEMRVRQLILIFILLLSFITFYIYWFNKKIDFRIPKLSISHVIRNINTRPLVDSYVSNYDFNRFDNQPPAQNKTILIVPNIIHFIRFDQPVFSYTDAICIIAAFKNQNPNIIMIHTNIMKLVGEYWHLVLAYPGLSKILQVHFVSIPTTVDRNIIRDYYSFIYRIKLMRQIGGIYLDNDVYVVKHLNDIRLYEFALPYNRYIRMANTRMIVAHRHARLLQKIQEDIEQFYDKGNRQIIDYLETVPTKIFALNGPKTMKRLHAEEYLFSIHESIDIHLNNTVDWRRYTVIGLMTKDRKEQFLLDDYHLNKCCFDMDTTFGEMGRALYDYYNYKA